MDTSSSLSTSPMAILPEEKQLTISIGIPLFELRKIATSHIDVSDYGYFDVRVTENVNDLSTRLVRSVNWYRGRRAYIRYYHDKRGVLTGYCPDDPDWFNRIKLASNIDSGAFKILRYHTPKGFYPEKRITDEILFLRDLLHEWRVEIDGRWACGYKNKREAEAFYNDKIKDNPTAKLKYGKVKQVLDLLGKYGVKWSLSPEFQNNVLPEMKEKIADKFKDTAPAGISLEDQIANVLSNNPDLIQRVLKKASGEQKEETIDDLSWQRLRSVAKERGINSQGMSKEALLVAVKENIKLSKETNDELSGKTEEEEPQKPVQNNGLTETVDF